MTATAGDSPLWRVPRPALLMLVGSSASGKSSWARSHFGDTEVVSSDRCRALVADDEGNQRVSHHAFAVFFEILRRRAAVRRRSVADSTGLDPTVRARLRQIGAEFETPIHVVVFLAPLTVLRSRNAARDRQVPEDVLWKQVLRLDRILQSGALEMEGYTSVSYLATAPSG